MTACPRVLALPTGLLAGMVTLALGAGAARADEAPRLGKHVPTGNKGPTNAEEVPAQLAGIGIDDKRGAVLPLDLALHDQDGNAVRLGDYFDGTRPVLLVMAYYRCPMLCTLVLNAVGAGLQALAWNPGERFRVVTVSIDPRDNAKTAHDKRANHLKELGKPVAPRGWDFLTTDEASVRRLTETIGFRYRWDERAQQYAHAAGVFVVTPAGKLSRTITGVEFPERTLRLALVEAADGKIGSAIDQIQLLCFHYDPSRGSFVANAFFIMRAGGALTVIAILAFLVFLRRSRRAQGALA